MVTSSAYRISVTNKLNISLNFLVLKTTESRIGENVNRPVFHVETEFGHCTYEVFEECVFIGNLYTKPECRKRGHARNLLNMLQERFKTDLYLDCFFTLKPFYERLGFAEYDSLPDNYFEMIRSYETFRKLSTQNTK